MLGSMYMPAYPPSFSHTATQQPLVNNTMVQDQSSSNTSATTPNFQNHHLQQQHQMLVHHIPASQSNAYISNQAGPSNFNNNINQQPLFNYQCYTPNPLQQPMSNISQYNQQLATSNQYFPPTINMSHQQINPQQASNAVIPMESEIDNNNFTLVNRKKKKVKIDSVHVEAPSPCTSTSSTTSTSSDNSTSSTNTSSIITNTDPGNNNSAQNKPGKSTSTDARCISNEISQQARRFAETRYAFPPFVIKFKQVVDEKTTIQSIMNHFSTNYKFDLNFAGHRLKEKRELLLFVDNRESFVMLYDDQKWPSTIGSLDYEKIRPKHLPPQFSIILRNVPVDIEIDTLLSNIKNEYPDVISAHRISNKNKQPTTFVRLDINSLQVIEELLGKKFIYIDNIRLAVAEYLAPAKVLVCTKCFMIGHFRSTCNSRLEYCRTCGVGVEDINLHKETCEKKQYCVRCKGPHESNDVRCPDIKSYRAILTKSLLSTTRTNNQQQINRVNYHHNDQDFPALRVNQNSNPHRSNYTSNNTGKRIDELFKKINMLDENLNRLIELNNNHFDQFTRIQHVVLKHEHELQLQQLDISFQRDFVSQYISPLGQVMVDVIPLLVKQNIINDKTLLCPSLTALCDKLANELPVWTNRFVQNENTKVKLINDFNIKNQQPPDAAINNKVHPPSIN